VDLAFNVELVALDLDRGAVGRVPEQALLLHVLLHLWEGDLGVSYVVLLAESVQVGGLSRQASLHLIDVEKGLSADLAGVGSQQDVLAGLLLHLVSKGDSLLEFELFQQCSRELGEAIRVISALAHNEG